MMICLSGRFISCMRPPPGDRDPIVTPLVLTVFLTDATSKTGKGPVGETGCATAIDGGCGRTAGSGGGGGGGGGGACPLSWLAARLHTRNTTPAVALRATRPWFISLSIGRDTALRSWFRILSLVQTIAARDRFSWKP